jgi:cell division transport system permease protein
MSARARPGRLLPREKGAAPLDVVIGVMAFLAALALGASLIADRAAIGWRIGLADRLTVQILPPAHGAAAAGLDEETGAVLAVLRATPGIAHAAPISETETLSLVQPWLGSDALVADLPLPRLIDATITPGAEVDLVSLTARLKQAAPDSLVDNHARWIARLKGLSDAVMWSAYGILLMIAIATAAAVSFATRAGLEAHHEMVALLHQMGAHSSFIARAFERHYFVSAFGAAAAGAALAAIAFLVAGGLEFVGVEAVPFLPPLALKLSEVPWLLAVPVVSALIALCTARLSVLAALREIY